MPEQKISENLIHSLASKTLERGSEDYNRIVPYLTRLRKGIHKEGINNIALCGGYGAGKSTILNTFLSEYYMEDNVLRISLATFNSKSEKKKSNSTSTSKTKKDNSNGNSNISKNEEERLVELSVLQQIFYHVNPTEIPQSRFKRITNYSLEENLGVITFSFIWIVSLVIFLKYSYIEKLNPNLWKLGHCPDWATWIMSIIIFIGFVFIGQKFVYFIHNFKINKISIKGDVELGVDDDASIFNKHIDEIIYFFEATKYDVLIIEDLDRFENIDIFSKLREINILLNNSKTIERKITFIYAIGDSLFEDKKDRVKFFEYIIPVIPFVNAKNAIDQLTLMIESSGIDISKFNKNFIDSITLLMDDVDMRLLTNIFQEFTVYKELLVRPNYNELLSIIIYKNLEPNDFSDLMIQKGRLYDLFSEKKSLITKISSEEQNRIKAIEKSVKDIENEIAKNKEELISIYIGKIIEQCGDIRSLKVGSNDIKISKLFEFDIIRELKNMDSLSYISGNGYNHHLGKSFQNIENEIDPKHTFEERLDFVQKKSNEERVKLLTEKSDLEKSYNKIKNTSIKGILIDYGDKQVVREYVNKFTKERSFYYLVMSGYLNENYTENISVFYGVTLSHNDNEFKKDVRSGKKSEKRGFDYKLTSVNYLFKELQEEDFGTAVILNYDLLDYLIINFHLQEVKEKLHFFIRRLSYQEDDVTIEFINGYLFGNRKSTFSNIFIREYANVKEDFLDIIKTYYVQEFDKLGVFLKVILSECDLRNWTQGIQTFKMILSEIDGAYLYIIESIEEKTYIENFYLILKGENFKFKDLNVFGENKISDSSLLVLQYIYTNHLYKLNNSNLKFLIGLFENDYQSNGSDYVFYSSILKLKNESLKEYILDNIGDFVSEVLLVSDNKNMEDKETVVELLCDLNIDLDYKKSLINKYNFRCDDISEIEDDSVVEYILSNSLMKVTWDNVFSVIQFNKNSYSFLIDYLNNERNVEVLSKLKVPLINNNENIDNEVLFEELLLSNELQNESFKKLLNSSSWDTLNLNLSKLSDQKKVAVIRGKFVPYSIGFFNEIQTISNSLLTVYIEVYSTEIEVDIDNLNIEVDGLIPILESKQISNSLKVGFVNQFYLEEDDLEILNTIINTFEGDDLLKLSQDNIHVILFNKELSREKRIELFNLMNVDDFSKKELIKFMECLEGDYKELLKGGSKNFLNNNFNKMFFERLKGSIVSSYKEGSSGKEVKVNPKKYLLK